MNTILNDTTKQAAWIAYDVAYRAAGGGVKGDKAGMKARNEVLGRAYGRAGMVGEMVEGPAEHPETFARRSSKFILTGER